MSGIILDTDNRGFTSTIAFLIHPRGLKGAMRSGSRDVQQHYYFFDIQDVLIE